MKSGKTTLMQCTRARGLLCALLLGHASLASAVTIGQVDDFGDGTTQGWEMGRQTITNTYMTNITTGGPAGAGDSYLQVTADNTSVAGGRLTFFNQAQWTGNYTSTGITAIAMDVRNFSSTETLNLRLAIEGGPSVTTGGLFATSASISLPSGSDWTHVVFSFAPGDLVSVSGRSGTTGNDIDAALANVVELRLLNSATPSWNGSPVGAILGIDNIHALVVPLPPAAVLFGSGLLGLVAGSRRRRSARQAAAS